MHRLNHKDFCKSHDRDGLFLNEWVTETSEASIEVLVHGDNNGPEEKALENANIILGSIEEIQAKAIRLLESFIKYKGTWYLGSINVSNEAKKQECDFQLDFNFEVEELPNEFMYTYFSVCFSCFDQNASLHLHPHPFKFIVGFR